jgi:hypothetical protein
MTPSLPVVLLLSMASQRFFGRSRAAAEVTYGRRESARQGERSESVRRQEEGDSSRVKVVEQKESAVVGVGDIVDEQGDPPRWRTSGRWSAVN